MPADEFKKLCSLGSLPQNRGVRIVIEDNEFAVFRVDSKVYVLSNICPHNHVGKIFEGEIKDGSVACPIHGWTFDLATGESTCNMSSIKSYEVKMSGNEVFIKIPKRLW